MKSILINIGHGDITEVEKTINEQIKDLKNFVSIKTTFNGQNTMAMVFYEGEESKITMPAVKIIEFPVTPVLKETWEKEVDSKLEELKGIDIDSTCIVDMNHLIVVYDASKTTKVDTNVPPEETDNPGTPPGEDDTDTKEQG